jgi:hypothetical protein
MRFTSTLRRASLLAFAALLLAGCGQILGLDSFNNGPTTTTTTTGSGGSTSTTTTTGTGGTGGSTGTGGTAGAGGMPDIGKICDAFAASNCGGLQKCAPDEISLFFGDVATCTDRYALFCTLVLGSPGTSWTPTRMSSCAADLGPLACHDFLLAPFTGGPASCVPPPGSLANGDGCYDAGQCQSGYCKRVVPSLCGTCGPHSASGEPCTNGVDCQPGLACTGGTCASAVAEGGACASSDQCGLDLSCWGGSCKKNLVENASCDAAGSVCEPLQQLYCNNQKGVCERATYNPAGQPCGFTNGAITACAGSGLCVSGTCVAPAIDGAACNPASGTGCMFPAVCSNGVCATGKPGSCN